MIRMPSFPHIRPNWVTGTWPAHCSASVAVRRSEEHTSELQSRPHLVCRLLLEKKKFIQVGSWPRFCTTLRTASCCLNPLLRYSPCAYILFDAQTSELVTVISLIAASHCTTTMV